MDVNFGCKFITFGSLFSGIGGFDLGFERAGLICRWQVEVDCFRQSVLRKHWPHVCQYDDVKNFNPGKDHQVHVICGGFPCKQTSVGASIHGKRKGLSGKDSSLWFEMLRVVQMAKPRWVVVENVPGAKAWSDTITRGLEDAGYNLPGQPVELSSESAGGPHLRRRLFWIANANIERLEVARKSTPFEKESDEGRYPYRNSWMSSISRVSRVDAGIPAGVDRCERVKAVGDSLCPHNAQKIGEYIMEVEHCIEE